jgi:hypothetical protein
MKSRNKKKFQYNKIFPGYQPCQLVKQRKTNVSRTICVLVFRVLMYLENQSASDIGLPFSTLKMTTKMVLETLAFLLLNQLTRLVAREYFSIQCRHESYKSYKFQYVRPAYTFPFEHWPVD